MHLPGRKSALMLAVVVVHCATRCNAQSTLASPRPDGPEAWFRHDAGFPPLTSDVAPSDALLQTSGSRTEHSRRHFDTSWRQTSWSSLSGWNAPGPRAVSQDCARPHEWQIMPEGLMYHAYVAGEKEPRIGLSILNDPDLGTIWDVALGGRIGLIRYGTRGAIDPEGWQIDLEGAALPRVDTSAPSAPLHATDYRFGIEWTRRRNGTAVKAGYYHISSHLGDEYLLNNMGFVRLNYVRDSLIFGVTRDLTPNWQGYGEIGYALGADGGAEPLEFQFGLQYDQRDRTNTQGAPFAAVNVHLREEVDFGGGINVLAGWRWRGAQSNHVLRIGLQFYNGKSIQYSFFNQSEQFAGGGIWVDY